MLVSNYLTNEILKIHSFVKYSSDEKPTNKIKKEIDIIESLSKKINENDISSLSSDNFDIIIPNNKQKLEDAVTNFANFISSAEHEIKILDPYLETYREGIKFYLSYLNKYLKKGVSIKIITLDQDKSKMISAKTWFESLGYNVEIITYTALGEHKTIKKLHDRFVFVDHKKCVKLGKGLTIIYELEKKGVSRDPITNDYYTDINKVRKHEIEIFDYLWNYQTCPDEEIKNWPKFDTRSLK